MRRVILLLALPMAAAPDSTTLFRLGSERLRAGDAVAAIRHYRDVLRDSPTHFGARANTGAAHAALGQHARAADAYSDALRRASAAGGADPATSAVSVATLAAVRSNLGASLGSLRRHAEAAYYIEGAIAMQEGLGNGRLRRGGS